MADLLSGGGGGHITTSNGNGASNRRPTIPASAPAPTGSPGIRTPRDIMQAREARKRAEAEKQALERARAEEARQLEDAQRSASERRAAGVAHGQGGAQQQPSTNPPRQGQISNDPSYGTQVPITTQPSHQRINSSRRNTNPPLPSQVYGQPSQQAQPSSQPQPQQQTQPSSLPPTGEPSGHASASSKPRNSFPHAFERWETLSAHWEGLTSYWIHKLEQNKDDLNRDPVSQQLARQVTDLSAAGANLFHAVVELQRLRASSERKFQRWFFETRAELERAQEVKSVLEADLEQERRNRAEAIRQAVERDQGNSLAEKQLAEMRKELAISKDEARRAWEELGRREQAERDRTLSLQSGQPTIVGGVQVVPMTQPGQQMGGQGSGNYASDYARGGYTSPQAQPSQPSGSAGPESYYRQEKSSSVLPPQQRSGGGGGSGGAFSEGEYVTDVQGNFILDMYGRRIPLDAPRSAGSDSDAEVEEYDTPATTNPPSRSHELPTSSATAPGPSGGQYTGNYDEQDYSGEGYAAPGWEEVPRQQAAPEWEKVPRHHHPTRLSDVMEEDDERSRTSTSQVSRG